MRFTRYVLPVVLLGALSVALAAAPDPPPADPQMQAVLDQLAALHPKPIEKCTPTEARKQPSPADAVKALLKKQGKSTAPEPVGSVQNTTIPGPGGAIPVRVYTPTGSGPFPVLVYIHGGGWVIATIDTYDSSPRALCNLAQCVVVSVEYRKASEHKFPAAHEDCYAALQYVMKHASSMHGDPKRVAVGGESAGGDMATAVCLMAKDRHGMMPVGQLDVYPVASGTLDWPSVQQNANAKPLNKPMLQWFFKYTLKTPSDAKNKLLDLVNVSNSELQGLPPATIITAEIDPLHDEGKAFADKLSQAGVKVAYRDYPGVTHEFFGMGAAVDKAKDAEQFAADGLKSAFTP